MARTLNLNRALGQRLPNDERTHKTMEASRDRGREASSEAFAAPQK